MQLATATLDCERFDYVAGSWLFWSEHHAGAASPGYARLSRYLQEYRFDPGACFSGWESLSDSAREIYRGWCERESVDCDYDSLRYVLEQEDWDCEDDCVSELLERYEHADPSESGLCNYEQSDWVNLDQCYTRDLIRFYDRNEDSVLHWADEACGAFGCTSRLQLLEGDTVETPDDMKTALVNHAMTYLARSVLAALEARA